MKFTDIYAVICISLSLARCPLNCQSHLSAKASWQKKKRKSSKTIAKVAKHYCGETSLQIFKLNLSLFFIVDMWLRFIFKAFITTQGKTHPEEVNHFYHQPLSQQTKHSNYVLVSTCKASLLRWYISVHIMVYARKLYLVFLGHLPFEWHHYLIYCMLMIAGKRGKSELSIKTNPWMFDLSVYSKGVLSVHFVSTFTRIP